MADTVTGRTGVPVRLRVLIALSIGLLCALVFTAAQAVPSGRDFDQCWAAARALLVHQNPYDVIGPGRAFQWRWPFYYPLTAAVIAIPFAHLSVITARLFFITSSATLLAFAVTRRSYHRLLLFISAGFCTGLLATQWGPLLTAAALLPVLGWVFAAKPTVGLALFAAYPSRVAVAGCGMLIAVSLVLMPSWPLSWWHEIRLIQHMRTALITPMGPLLLLALLRWRRPEARLLVALACVPQTLILYMTVPLFLVPASVGESLTLVALSWTAQVITYNMRAQPPNPAFYTYSAWVIVTLMYLPCLVMVLRRRNEGTLPASAEALVAWVHRRRRAPATPTP